jgi:hypothetical protein
MFGVPEEPVRDLAPLLAHIEGHSRRLDPEALRERLIQDGYPPADVDRAIAISGEESSRKEPGRFRVLWVLVFNVFIFFIVINLNPNLISSAFYMLAITGVETFLGLVLKASEGTRNWGRALAVGGGIFFVPLLVACGLGALIVGLCAGSYRVN